MGGPIPPIPIPYHTSEMTPLQRPADANDALKIDDDVMITSKLNGKRYEFTITQLKDDGFIGEQDGKKYQVLYANVSRIEVERGEWHVFWIH